MPRMTDQAVRQQRAIGPLLMVAVLLGLLGLPVAVWLDLRSLSEQPAAAAGERDRPDHRRHARLLCQRRRRPGAPGAWPGHHRRRRLSRKCRVPSRSPPPCRSSSATGSAPMTARSSTASSPTCRSRGASAIRSTRSSSRPDRTARRSQPIGGRGHRLDPRSPGADRDPGADGRGLRRAATTATPTARSGLEGRRRARHPGDLGLAALGTNLLAFKYLLAYLRARRPGRHYLHPDAAAPGAADPRHQHAS